MGKIRDFLPTRIKLINKLKDPKYFGFQTASENFGAPVLTCDMLRIGKVKTKSGS